MLQDRPTPIYRKPSGNDRADTWRVAADEIERLGWEMAYGPAADDPDPRMRRSFEDAIGRRLAALLDCGAFGPALLGPVAECKTAIAARDYATSFRAFARALMATPAWPWPGEAAEHMAPRAIALLLRQKAEEALAAEEAAPAQAAAPPAADTAPDAAEHRWQEVQQLAECHVRKAGDRYPGDSALAAMLDCSRATITKACDRSTYLAARRAEYLHARRTAAREVPLDDAMLDDIAQDRHSQLEKLAAEQKADQTRDERQQARAVRNR